MAEGAGNSEAPRSEAIVTRVKLAPGLDDAFANWQARFTRTAREAGGCLSVEVTPDAKGPGEWRLIQRFRTAKALADWRISAERRGLIADWLATGSLDTPTDEPVPVFDPLACVTEVVTTVVEPGKTAAFVAWQERIQARQAQFPGYQGTLVQAPVSAEAGYWTTLVRFSTPEALDAWLESAERKALLDQADPGMATWKIHRMASPFAGWFPTPGDQPATAAWKQTALVLLVLFPVVMLEMRFLSPFLAGQHRAVATFIGNGISVTLVSWPLMKIAVWVMGWWLQPAANHRWRTELVGGCVMLGLYAIELATFMLVA